MNELANEIPAEEIAKPVTPIGVPQNTLTYILLGVISMARKLLTKAVVEGCPGADANCVDFTDIQAGTDLGVVHEKEGFAFTALDQKPLRVIGWGVPAGQSKLAVRQEGVEIKFPHATTWVAVRGAQYTGNPLVLRAFDEEDQVAEVTAAPQENNLQTLKAQGERMTRAVLSGGGNEGLLFETCIPHEEEIG